MKNNTRKKVTQVKKPIIEKKQGTISTFPHMRWGVILSFAVGFIIYSNTFNHGWVLDDYGVLADNWVIKEGTSGIPTILNTTYRYGINHLTDNLYRPLSQVMFAIEWEISPDNPGFHHIINVVFYALCCALLFVFLYRLLKNHHPWVPLLITLLYAAHPIHSEVVANIKSRDEIMSLFFILISGILLIRYFESNKLISLICASLSFGLSMFSKEGGVTLVLVFPIMGWFFYHINLKKASMVMISLLVPALIYIVIRRNIVSAYSTSDVISIVDNYMVGSGYVQQFSTAIMLMGKYLLLLFVPYQLVCDYSYSQLPLVGPGNPYFLLSFAIHAFLLFIAIRELRKKTLLSFGILFYLLTMSLYSNIVLLIGTSFGERLLFLPSLGFFMAVVAFVERIAKLKPAAPKNLISWLAPHKGYALVMIIILVLYSSKTVVRAAEWESQIILFGADIKRSPNSAHMRLYYGLALRDKALDLKDENKQEESNLWMKKALKEFEKGIEIYPEYTECMDQAGMAHYRLGNSEKAMYYYEETLKRIPDRPVTLSNMGTLYFEKGDYEKALELYEKSVTLDKRYTDGWFNLGSTYGTLGQYEKAITAYETCIELDEKYAKAYYFMGMTYDNMKQPEKAKPYYEKAAQLDSKMKRD
ncbi:MAG: tetratricopeptide repeat protein [Candidatus Competibacteraceae bacterium]|nr:tetratricopeptide repeat protein [Candidatus Competibacteraceae bacterium]